MDQNTNMKKEDYEHDMEKLENEVSNVSAYGTT